MAESVSAEQYIVEEMSSGSFFTGRNLKKQSLFIISREGQVISILS